MNRIHKNLKNPYAVLLYILKVTKLANLLPDKLYLQLLFRRVMGKKLNLKNPQTFNEKLNWLKLYDRNPEYCRMVDKYEVKKYVASIIGEEYIIPTYGVWEKFDDIDFNQLPDQFVLKCTHDSGSVVICDDKKTFDFKSAKSKLEKALKTNLFYSGREYPYKNLKPRIIAEHVLKDNDDRFGLTDYKFFCFNGYVHSVMVCVDREINEPKFYFFDKDWELLRINKRGIVAPSNFTLNKPTSIDKMFDIASELSLGIPFVRIDLYNTNDKIYFGEITLYPTNGLDKNLLFDTDLLLGELIRLTQ